MIIAVIKRGDLDSICRQFGDRLAFLGICGSYAYGTYMDKSDLSLRGIVSLSKSDILSNQDFGVFTSRKYSTVIFSTNNFIFSAANGNIDTLEMLNLPDTCVYTYNQIYTILKNNKYSIMYSTPIYNKITEIIQCYKKVMSKKIAKGESVTKIMASMLQLLSEGYLMLLSGEMVVRQLDVNILKDILNGDTEYCVNNKHTLHYVELLNEMTSMFDIAYSKSPLECNINYDKVKQLNNTINSIILSNN